MCYSLSQRYYKSYKSALNRGADASSLEELYTKFIKQYQTEQQQNEENKDIRYYYVNGFAHPQLVVICGERNQFIQEMEWGLIPEWCKNSAAATKMSNSCLNARGETVFEKAAFQNAAKNRRCIIMLDSFFEYHHYQSRKYPFRIKRKDNKDLLLAGLWEEWVDKETGEIRKTCCIVTTQANEMMSKIHNNPNLSGPRMPVILSEQEGLEWLLPVENEMERENIEALIKPCGDELLLAYAVPQLMGKTGVGNSPLAHTLNKYESLDIDL